MSNCICSSDADTLSKYIDIFPEKFIEAIRDGVSWMCHHHRVTYKTSLMLLASNEYEEGDAILKVGLLDPKRIHAGYTFYEVVSIEETRDSRTDKLMFTAKLRGTRPVGIKIHLIPITLVDLEEEEVPSFDMEQVEELLNKYLTLDDFMETSMGFVLKEDYDTDKAIILNDQELLKQRIVKLEEGNGNNTNPDGSYNDTEIRQLIADESSTRIAEDTKLRTGIDKLTLDLGVEIQAREDEVNRVELAMLDGDSKIIADVAALKTKVDNFSNTGTTVDLSGYLTKTEASTEYSTKTELADYLTKLEAEVDYSTKAELTSAKSDLEDKILLKQDVLVAGAGIKIENGTISANISSNGNIDTSDLVSKSELNAAKASLQTNIDAKADTTALDTAKTELQSKIDETKTTLETSIASKQDSLTAGTGIDISNGVISSTVTLDTTTLVSKAEMDAKITEVETTAIATFLKTTDAEATYAAKTDLTGYATQLEISSSVNVAKDELNKSIEDAKTELTASIADKAATTDLETAKTELQASIATKADSSTLDSTKTDLESQITAKADATTVTDLSNKVTTNESAIAKLQSAQKIVNYIQATDTQINEGDLVIYLSKVYVCTSALTVNGSSVWDNDIDHFKTVDEKSLNVVDYTAGIEIQEGYVVSYIDPNDQTNIDNGLYICKGQIDAATDWATDKAYMIAVNTQVDFSNYYNKSEVDSLINETKATVTSQVTTSIQTLQTAVADINTNIGIVADLTTTNKTLVLAVNELDTDYSTLDTKIDTVKTELTTSISDAKSELQTNIDAKPNSSDIDAAKTEMETKINEAKTALETSINAKANTTDLDSAKTDLQSKIDAKADSTALATKADSSTIGELTSLTTTAQDTIVNAINEINTKIQIVDTAPTDPVDGVIYFVKANN